MKHLRGSSWLFLVVAVLWLCSCSGGSSGSGSASSGSPSSGSLNLSLVDKPAGSYEAVYVTIKEVQVCHAVAQCDESIDDDCECQWETVATVNKTFNLLELVNGVMAGLGQKDLESGTYNQMRLFLGSEPDDGTNLFDEVHPFAQYLIDEWGVVHEMKVPSGFQTGIKLNHPFQIVRGLTTELILDFDVARSVIKAGSSGKYLLKPTIKVIGTHNRAIVSGVVSSSDGPLEGAQVTAWQQDEGGNWSVAMSTMTDSDGGYMLYLDLGGQYELDPKDYKIVVSADGFEPDCAQLTVEVDMTYPNQDFILELTEIVTVNGTITGTAPSIEESTYPEIAPVVEVAFNRQVGECFIEPVETAFIQATDDGDESTENVFYDSSNGSFQYFYSIDLPAGLYDVTASSEGLDSLDVMNFSVSLPGPVELNFDFNVDTD